MVPEHTLNKKKGTNFQQQKNGNKKLYIGETNVSPWITTVGASTMDRDFPA